MPKSVKFHEPSKQEVDLVKSIPQGGLGVAGKSADESQAGPLPGAWPARMGDGGGGGGAACSTSGAKNKY